MGKLYLVEGLPCSGKSTTAKYLADLLTARGEDVCCVDEGTGDHPVDYEFHACVTEADLALLPGDVQAQVRRNAQKTAHGYITALHEFHGAALEVLLPFKIYDFLPWEKEREVILDKWRAFVDAAGEESYIFNCVLLQNPMCETMMRFDFSEERSRQFIAEIVQIIRPLDPTVIYLHTDGLAARVHEVAKEREGWLDAVIDYHVHGAYGRRTQAAGFAGYIACLEERQKREMRILEQLEVRSLIIKRAGEDWPGTHVKIRQFIDAQTASLGIDKDRK